MVELSPEARVEFERFYVTNSHIPLTKIEERAADVSAEHSKGLSLYETERNLHVLGFPESGKATTPQEATDKLGGIHHYYIAAGTGTPTQVRLQSWLESESEEELKKGTFPMLHPKHLEEYFDSELREPSHKGTKQLVDARNGIVDIVAIKQWEEEEMKEPEHKLVRFQK